MTKLHDRGRLPVNTGRKASFILLFLFAVLLSETPAVSFWLSVCDRKATELPISEIEVEYLNPTGPTIYFRVGDSKPQDCQSILLPLRSSDILWGGLISEETTNNIEEVLILQGRPQNHRFYVSEVIPVDPARDVTLSSLAALPLNTNLLDEFQVIPFGAEERASVELGDDGLALECRAGRRPAGALLRVPGSKLPALRQLELRMRYSARGRLRLGVSDAARIASEEPWILGHTETDVSNQDVALPLPEIGLDRSGPVMWSLICPKRSARMEIQELTLGPQRPPGTKRARSMWFWDPTVWQESADALLGKLEEFGVAEVYLTVPLSDDDSRVAKPERLEEFLGKAASRGIAVWAVEGDPRAVLPDERAKFVRRARGFAEFNRTVPEGRRLRGIQYDIEPYLVRGFQLQPNSWFRAYVDTVTALEAAAEMPIELAVPFWWANQRLDGDLLLPELAPLAESFAIMNYRTDPARIQASAEPILAWGSSTGHRIRIALEAGPIDDELRKHFRKAPAGELWLVTVGRHDALVLLTAPKTNPLGPAFAEYRASVFTGDQITFHNNIPALHALVAELETLWSAWPAFAGVALHGFELER